MQGASVGLDIAKHVFQLHGVDEQAICPHSPHTGTPTSACFDRSCIPSRSQAVCLRQFTIAASA